MKAAGMALGNVEDKGSRLGSGALGEERGATSEATAPGEHGTATAVVYAALSDRKVAEEYETSADQVLRNKGVTPTISWMTCAMILVKYEPLNGQGDAPGVTRERALIGRVLNEMYGPCQP